MNIQKITWYFKRLSKMPLPEIPWRIKENFKKRIDSKRSFNIPSHINLFNHPAQSVFKLSNLTDDPLSDINPSVKGLNHHLTIANEVLDNRFNAFGNPIAFPSSMVNWSTDPVTGKSWPLTFWGNIDYRNKTLGGVKFVWEYNRLYFLFSLSIAYHVTGEKKYADKIFWLLKSWLKGNPYPTRVNWTSGIEAGVRLANLVWALSFLKEYPFSNDDLKAINTFVWWHAIRLHRYPSLYSSANNHLLAEGFGLFLAGLYFPHLQGADIWFKEGKNILEAEVTRQILPDGGSFEFSTTYLSFVFDFFLLFKRACDTCEVQYDPALDQRLAKSCEFIHTLLDSSGNLPNIGDQDSAVLVDFGMSNMENFTSILNTGAILFDRPEWHTGKPDLKTCLLTGKSYDEQLTTKSKTTSLNSPSPFMERGLGGEVKAIHHHLSALSVIRDEVNGKEIVFTGNAMPLGMPPLCGHGHLDALSFTLSVDGLEIFVDPGTYLYHNSEPWRSYFRSTAAHNTIRINQMDLSPQTGYFMYGKPYRITEHTLETQEDRVIWSAAHDAYAKRKPHASVRRQVTWVPDKQTFTIEDSIHSSEKVLVERFFHFHPECDVVPQDGSIVIQRGGVVIKMGWEGDKEDVEIFKGSKEPLAGWFSPAFNQLMECVTVRFTNNLPIVYIRLTSKYESF
ncbi:Heparinase II/III family protein [Desulfamplus magnetovallimortis]|uniref:Heparinase II/III family protein n=1 Tax=Desulfamplus magnetovallimortis TaxID=1246637 RepID=A0A1W1H8E0_9BACT|nr:alginate lyase family protein [Desulfamplus magnetovallimortis]SLM28706.1 Heparinase II/III family protein [Desulfamplus magnetovallimortis]